MPDSLAKLAMPEAEPATGRRFVAVALVLALAALAATAAANVAVNPRAEFAHRFVDPVVTEAPSEKAHALRRLAADPQVIVLGTSRGAALEPTFGGRSGFNMAIPGGNWADLEDAYRFAARERGTPEVVILALDSFQFSRLQYQTPYLPQSSAGAEIRGDRRGAGDWTELLAGTLSASYTWDSLRAIRFHELSSPPVPFFAYDERGVQGRPLQDQQRAAGTFDLAAEMETVWRNVEVRYPADAVVPRELAGDLVAFVAGLESQGVEVHVFLTAFQPDALARLRTMPGFVRLDAAARGVLPDLCAVGAQVHDYTEVASWGGAPDGFYDAYHLTPENAARLRAALEQGVSPAC